MANDNPNGKSAPDFDALMDLLAKQAEVMGKQADTIREQSEVIAGYARQQDTIIQALLGRALGEPQTVEATVPQLGGPQATQAVLAIENHSGGQSMISTPDVSATLDEDPASGLGNAETLSPDGQGLSSDETNVTLSSGIIHSEPAQQSIATREVEQLSVAAPAAASRTVRIGDEDVALTGAVKTLDTEREAMFRMMWGNPNFTAADMASEFDCTNFTIYTWAKKLAVGVKAGGRAKRGTAQLNTRSSLPNSAPAATNTRDVPAVTSHEWREDVEQGDMVYGRVLFVRGKGRFPLPAVKAQPAMRPFFDAYNEWCNDPKLTLLDVAKKLGIAADTDTNTIMAVSSAATKFREDPYRTMKIRNWTGGGANAAVSVDAASPVAIPAVPTVVPLASQPPLPQPRSDFIGPQGKWLMECVTAGIERTDAEALWGMGIQSFATLRDAGDMAELAESLGLQTTVDVLAGAIANIPQDALVEMPADAIADDKAGDIATQHANGYDIQAATNGSGVSIATQAATPRANYSAETQLADWLEAGFDETDLELLSDEGIKTIGDILDHRPTVLQEYLGGEMEMHKLIDIVVNASVIAGVLAPNQVEHEKKNWRHKLGLTRRIG